MAARLCEAPAPWRFEPLGLHTAPRHSRHPAPQTTPPNFPLASLRPFTPQLTQSRAQWPSSWSARRRRRVRCAAGAVDTGVSEKGGKKGGRLEDDEEVKRVVAGTIGVAEALAIVDRCLEGGEDRKAVRVVEALREREGGLRGFDAAAQVPQRQYSLSDLRLNKIEAEKLLAPTDATLGSVRLTLQLAAAAGVATLIFVGGWDMQQLLGLVVFVLLLGTTDQVVNGGGGANLLLDSAGQLLSSTYRNRVAQHEAGHFLVSYLLGVLPRAYTLSSYDAFKRYGALNVQAGTTFVDYEYEQEVASGKLSSKMLDRFTCIALAGVAVEYLKYDRAEGGVADVQQLDGLLRSLGFTQKRADQQVRWAVLNTITLLRRHSKAHDALAEAMAQGKSVGACIQVIESFLKSAEEI